MLIHPVRTKLIQTLGFRPFRCRPLSLGSNPVSFNLSRFMSSQDKGAVPVKKKKESEMTFSPLNPPDIFLQRRQKKFYEQFASKEGKTNTGDDPVGESPKTSLSTLFSRKLFYFVILVGFGAYVIKILPHSHLKDLVRDVLQHHDVGGANTRVSSHLEALIREVMRDINLDCEEIATTKTFINSSDENTSSLGGYQFTGGHLLGIPNIMNYKSLQDIPLDRMKFRNELLTSEQISSLVSRDYLPNLILSDEAKKFVIAREILRGKKSRHFYEAFFPLSFLSFSAPFLSYLSLLTNLKWQPKIVKWLAYIVSASIICVVYLSFEDFWHKNIERELDAAACQLGVVYAQGGVEFYDKSLRRHIALRELLPNDSGKKLYNLKGDLIPGLLRTKYLAVSSRKESCESFLEK